MGALTLAMKSSLDLELGEPKSGSLVNQSALPGPPFG